MVLRNWVSTPSIEYEYRPQRISESELTRKSEMTVSLGVTNNDTQQYYCTDSFREIAKDTNWDMSKAEKRIPVTEERWRELNNLKEPGQTYDELIQDLVEEHKKLKLQAHIEQLREEQEEFIPLDEV